jgi:preprotein translocase subunit SecG
MTQVVLIIHLLLALALVGVVLIQRSEGGALGMGGGGGGGGLMSARGQANLLTRTTAILAGAFMVTSVVLALLSGHRSGNSSSIIDGIAVPAASAPATPVDGAAAPATSEPAAPATGAPAVPLSQ